MPVSLRDQVQAFLGRLVRSYIAFAVGVLVILTVGIFYYYERNTLQNWKGIVHTKLQTDLFSLTEQIEALSNSSVLWTGLTDSMGREAYLEPLMQRFNKRRYVRFTVLDYRGRPFIGPDPVQARYVAQSVTIPAAVGGEKGTSEVIRSGSEGDVLLLMRPILSPQSDHPAGYLVATLPVSLAMRDMGIGNAVRIEFSLSGRFQRSLPPWYMSVEMADVAASGQTRLAYALRLSVGLLDGLGVLALFLWAFIVLGIVMHRRIHHALDNLLQAMVRRLDQLIGFSRDILSGTSKPERIRAIEGDDEISPIFQAMGTILTEQKRTADTLRRASRVFETAAEAIVMTDAGGRIVDINPAVSQITGYAREDLIGKSAGMLYRGNQPSDMHEVIRSSLRVHEIWKGEAVFLSKEGKDIPALVAVSRLGGGEGSEPGAIEGYVSVFTDISLIKAAQEQLRRMAYEDMLTGLPNFRAFYVETHDKLRALSAGGGTLTLLYADIDRLKSINDTYGHEAGDAVIKQVADHLRRLLPQPSLLCRRSGDEFVAWLEAEDDALQRIASAICDVIVDVESWVIPVTVCVGAARFPQDAKTFDTLMFCADSALREAKRNGRHSYTVFDAHLGKALMRRRAIETRLAYAIEQGSIVPFYQPEVNMLTGAIVGFEVLARWFDEALGWVAPDEFVPIAEDMRLMDRLSLCLLDQVIPALPRLRARFGPLHTGFNVSPQVFADSAVIDYLVRAERFQPGLLHGLELELTESDMADLEDAVLRQLDRLIDHGIRIAIDDFGKAYSSLGRLAYMPIHRLKIDASFTRWLEEGHNEKIVRLIVDLAKSLGLEVTVEGIETAAQRRILIDCGCVNAQGWLYANDLRLDEALALPVILPAVST